MSRPPQGEQHDGRVRSFSYIDLALQDTPINDPETEASLRDWVQQVDNFGDREDQKLARMDIRFSRVRAFIDYLRREEEQEAQQFDLPRASGVWSLPVMGGIAAQIDRELEWIQSLKKMPRWENSWVRRRLWVALG